MDTFCWEFSRIPGTCELCCCVSLRGLPSVLIKLYRVTQIRRVFQVSLIFREIKAIFYVLLIFFKTCRRINIWGNINNNNITSV